MGFPFEPVKIGSFKALQRLLQNNTRVDPIDSVRNNIFKFLQSIPLKSQSIFNIAIINTYNYYKRTLLLFETWFILFACVIHNVGHLLTI